MNCDTYLSLLETLPVEELAYGGAREHAAVCRDCDRVTRVVFERERNMVMAFGELYPPVPAESLAHHALVMSRRRKLAFYLRSALGVAAAALILFVFVSRIFPTNTPTPTIRSALVETFPLRCLSPEQALEVLRPYASPGTRISAEMNSTLGIIRVVASPEEMQRLRGVLDRFDDANVSQCGVVLTVPKDVRSR
jgi:hypothetical protein